MGAGGDSTGSFPEIDDMRPGGTYIVCVVYGGTSLKRLCIQDTNMNTFVLRLFSVYVCVFVCVCLSVHHMVYYMNVNYLTETPMAYLARQPQFTQLRHVLQNNPTLLQPILQQIGQSNPRLLQVCFLFLYFWCQP